MSSVLPEQSLLLDHAFQQPLNTIRLKFLPKIKRYGGALDTHGQPETVAIHVDEMKQLEREMQWTSSRLARIIDFKVIEAMTDLHDAGEANPKFGGTELSRHNPNYYQLRAAYQQDEDAYMESSIFPLFTDPQAQILARNIHYKYENRKALMDKEGLLTKCVDVMQACRSGLQKGLFVSALRSLPENAKLSDDAFSLVMKKHIGISLTLLQEAVDIFQRSISDSPAAQHELLFFIQKKVLSLYRDNGFETEVSNTFPKIAPSRRRKIS